MARKEVLVEGQRIELSAYLAAQKGEEVATSAPQQGSEVEVGEDGQTLSVDEVLPSESLPDPVKKKPGRPKKEPKFV